MPYVHGKSIIRIAIADADELLQDLLPGFIDSIENCKVVLQAFSGPELIEKLKQKPDTDLVIMDIRLPELDGIETAKKIKIQFPGIKILVFSVYQNELAFCRVIGAGCDGFIKKGSTSVCEKTPAAAL
jgi:DNA-binding NarL/FixJ family response regulator